MTANFNPDRLLPVVVRQVFVPSISGMPEPNMFLRRNKAWTLFIWGDKGTPITVKVEKVTIHGTVPMTLEIGETE